MAVYALYRMTRREAPPADDTESYLGVVPVSSPVAVESANAWAADHAEATHETDPSE